MSAADPRQPASDNRPRATVRLQLHAGFTLDDARAQLPYFAALGISHLYLSPITQARAGSTHGYDVIDHGQVNVELGGEAALRRLAAAARANGLGLIADIVPNHMAADVANAWWSDVLRHGERSPHSRCFDIDWRAPDPALRGKVLLPVLPEPYGICLENGAITLAYTPGHGYAIAVGGQHYPLEQAPQPEQHPARTCEAHAPATPQGRRRLHQLLERQHYRLAWWRTAPDQINWRRFFEITELVGVRVEDDVVFDAVHALPLRLFGEGLLDGLRIDHIDGLAMPGAYLRRLRAALAEAASTRAQAGLAASPYLIVEKILAPGEPLDPRWPAEGTTGYDFMDQVGALLHAPAARAPLEAFWQTLADDRRPPAAQLLQARQLMLARHFAAERLVLVRALTRIARLDLRTRDWTAPAIDRVLSALLAAFPAYRSYAEDGGRGAIDRQHWQTALAGARACLPAPPDSPDGRLLDLLDRWLDGSAGEPQEDITANALRSARSRALRHFQQLTPPLAAKALEDTLFYRYGPLLSRNEVGSSPAVFSLEAPAFLDACGARARSHPDALLATATHDHKRGEDSRARLAALTEIPLEWIARARGWIDRLAGHDDMPSRADRYLLLQTLVGAWPLALAPAALDDRAVAAFIERVAQWQQKALREAKLHTRWTAPDAPYESAARHVLDDLVDSPDGRGLLREIGDFAWQLAPAGLINSLAQTLLRNTLPGVPDLYQGAELWDFSLVDPDNRRPVDYGERAALLAQTASEGAIDTRAAAWRSGAIKQALIQRTLALRARHPALLREGALIPVEIRGPRAPHLLAFLRRHARQALLVIVPRHCATAIAGYACDDAATARAYWADTRVLLPSGIEGGLLEIVSDRRYQAATLDIADLLRDTPVALCLMQDTGADRVPTASRVPPSV
ncbi:malto-oligosyltrehalose synthase [Achromobacter deleyi]|uniref:Malto-oligosyltrehalose synthase n=1 Tax=Achromobacter deleyi TaxID=1353891 RepID=A0A7T4E0S5_9BURK|nr:malto-oligosyltrehalose synthase [Achromobacter deleyi]QQB32482.1 malto-oligosyltrehalose synthase [Achromobacter deleyi]